MSPLLMAVALFAAEPNPPVQKIDFDPDLISGTLSTPDVLHHTHRKRPNFPTLIKVRENFSDKIVRSVDQM